MIKKYPSRIISIENLFDGIYTITFESLAGQYKFYPGQFLHISIDPDYDGVGQWPESRCFSMQSNPDEPYIKITYAVKGLFTKNMENQLKVGNNVWLKMPYGDLFTQEHSKENTVFIAGGTGVTPFLSLFTHPSFSEYKNPHIYLGFKNRSYNIYENSLSSVELSATLKVYYENENGIINIAQILEESDRTTSFFISGPPIMIKTFKSYLVVNGVGENQVKTDDWE